MFKTILLGAGLFAALIAVLIFSGRIPLGNKADTTPTGDVMVWGTIPQDAMDALLQEINVQTKTYRVDYQEIPEADFSNRLVNALASGSGPDLIIAPYQTLLEQRGRIMPFPSASLPEATFKSVYVDGASVLLTSAGVIGLPISIEPLMLFYNRTLLSQGGIINPPTTWDEVTNVVSSLTKLDSNNRIIQSGLAFGSASNLTTAKDVLMTLVYQLGQTPVIYTYDEKGKEYFDVRADQPIVEDGEVRPLTSALRYFASFADPTKSVYSWNALQPNATEQFSRELLAMYVGYLGDQKALMEKNPRLSFGMKVLPQSKGYKTKVTGMRMYAIAAMKRTTNPFATMTAQGFLAGTTFGPRIAYIAGGVSPVRSVLAKDGSVPPEVVQSALIARGWFDQAPNTTLNYIRLMVNDVVTGKSTPTDSVALFISRMLELYTK
jgi:ABC-type glycerol-3-phosphate transport system substrate-binding protein